MIVVVLLALKVFSASRASRSNSSSPLDLIASEARAKESASEELAVEVGAVRVQGYGGTHFSCCLWYSCTAWME